MRSVLFWGLFPFLLPQAFRVRKTAPRFAAATGPNQGTAGETYHSERRTLIAIGDSIIAGVGAGSQQQGLASRAAALLAQSLLCPVEWKSVGKIGVTSQDVLNQLVLKLPPLPADFIAVSVGVNDLTSLSTTGTFKKRLNQLLLALRAHSPQAIVAIAGIPPLRGFPLLPQPLRALFGMRGDSFDQAIRAVVAQHPNMIHVPLDFDPTPDKFSADGFHPSEQSYKEFGEGMAQHMLQLIPANEQ
jgi:lysophospholipase L1-like esterase